jgi:hypothetical protein
MEIATTIIAEVILRAQLPFSTHSSSADRKRRTEPKRLLHDGQSFRVATAKSAMHAINVRRARMTANLAESLLHHMPLQINVRA